MATLQMTGLIHVTKIDAAQRQLNLAIRLLFEDADMVAVHTLVATAANLLTDLAEHQAPDRSWDTLVQKCTGITKSAYFNIMRKEWNFFKHAKNDHNVTLEFDPIETEHLAFWAVMNASELTPMSIEAQVFQLWYIASHAPTEDRFSLQVGRLFGDLRCVARTRRLQIGMRRLLEECGT